MALLFISSLVPDTPAFQNAAFTRSGNNVLLGIAKSLNKDSNLTLLSMRPMPSFPRGSLWIKGGTTVLDSGEVIRMLPTFNIKIIKNLIWNFLVFFFVIKWALSNREEKREILVYNIYLPSISTLYRVARLTRSKIFAILYDLGVPPKRLGLSKITMMAYRFGERAAVKYIPKLDGRIVINENIIKHYAPGKDFILIDGGINDNLISNLKPLEISKSSRFSFVLAGMLWDQNGTKLILDTMKDYPDLNIDIIFAGKGIDVPIIEAAAVKDSRIKYVGMLTMEELFKLYSKSDVLLNLRLEEEVDFHFPSKLLEYMATGCHVVSTPIAHAEREYGDYVTILKDISPKGLANTIKGIIASGKQELFIKGKKSRDFMLANRTWQIQTKRIEDYILSKG